LSNGVVEFFRCSSRAAWFCQGGFNGLEEANIIANRDRFFRSGAERERLL